MSALFGGMSNKSRDISDIVASLQGGTTAICNESVAGKAISDIEVSAMADQIKSIMLEHYSGILPDERFETMLQEDAESVAQIFQNNLVETHQISGAMNESASLPSLVTLTASIATTMRTPYEAVLHRLFHTILPAHPLSSTLSTRRYFS